MNIALVLSGGIGRRVISDVPKQYVTIRGRMVVTYCLNRICKNDAIDAVHIVAEMAWWDQIQLEIKNTSKLRGFSVPGENRQLSILNGLNSIKEYASDTDTVLIHDAVRPMVSPELIKQTIGAVEGHDGAVPVLPLKDTVYSSDDGRSLTGILERSKILAGQAPEAFVLGKYLKANESLTRDEILKISGSAEPALMAGLDIVTLPGDEKNFKITTNEDLDRFINIVKKKKY